MPNDAGAFQMALYERLAAAPGLVGITIADMVKQAEDGRPASGLPAIEIGDFDVLDWGTASGEGDNIAFRLHVWMPRGSLYDLRAVQGVCKDLLHRQQAAFTLPHGRVVMIRRDRSTVLQKDRHGVCDYRALIDYE